MKSGNVHSDGQATNGGPPSIKKFTEWTLEEPPMFTVMLTYFQYTLYALIGYVEDLLARMGWMKVPVISEHGNKVKLN